MGDSKKNKIEDVIHKHEQSGKYFEVDGQKTFALDFGEGEVVLCIHGVPTSSFLYRKVLRSLADKGYRGISIDLPGLGLSARPKDFNYTFSNFAEFLSKAIKALDVKKFHLVVHDIGGPVGFVLAARQLENILSLTILNTWVDVVNFKKPLPMRPFEKKILGDAQLKMMTRETWPVMFSKLGVSDSNKIPSEEIKAYVDLLKREDNGKAFLKIMRQFPDSTEFRDTCLQAVQGTPYPIQAIWGEEDPGLTYERYGKEIEKMADLKEMTLLPSKHFLQEEVWEEIAVKIDELAKTAY
ncbi:alpha/beta hydrolase [Zunongwangia sp. F260]|uniref:Alpha/beta hydrolase n=1 Tax=Autumnicola lenta TaxID=3075593 RepID=A0ABU3CHY6_9FLAO|nr:alpha/beta hydrolase [Zunongwangia sp. F260]MDT0645954.1 alpha/beta hydrolase [Zunongwangia sp. F260]